MHHTKPMSRFVPKRMAFSQGNLALSLGLPAYHLARDLLSIGGLEEPVLAWEHSQATYLLNAALHWWLPSLLLLLAIRQYSGSWLRPPWLADVLLMLSNLTLMAFLASITVQHLRTAGPGYSLAGPFQRVWLVLAGAGWVVLAASTITRFRHARQAGCGRDGLL